MMNYPFTIQLSIYILKLINSKILSHLIFLTVRASTSGHESEELGPDGPQVGGFCADASAVHVWVRGPDHAPEGHH